MKTYKSIFPYDQSFVNEYPLMGDAEINVALERSEIAFVNWRRKSFKDRSEIMNNVAAVLKNKKEELGSIITKEMGKPLKDAIAEIEKCAGCCEYFAQHAEQFLKDAGIEAGYTKSFVSYEPLGTILAIMPWNFPFWQVFRFAAPTLMAGNVAILKHSASVCGCSLAIQQVFEEAGAEEGVWQSLIIENEQAEKLMATRTVKALSLTGSEPAGSVMAAAAGKQIKKSVLELGGSDSFIVLEDADVRQAAITALQARMQNAGQSCIAAKRFIVMEKVYNDFLKELEREVKTYVQGDPFDPATVTGPMARQDLAANLKRQMEESLDKGAHLIHGGNVYYCNFKPTLLINLQEGMPAFKEETFGPLLGVIMAKNEKQAIQLANDTNFGLGGNLWTKDIEKGIRLAREISCGCVFINSMVKSDARLPFGGINKSGFGRELSWHGIQEFVNIKTIVAEQA